MHLIKSVSKYREYYNNNNNNNNNNNINFIEPINAEANKTMFYSLQSLRKNDVAYTIKNSLLIIKCTIKMVLVRILRQIQRYKEKS